MKIEPSTARILIYLPNEFGSVSGVQRTYSHFERVEPPSLVQIQKAINCGKTLGIAETDGISVRLTRAWRTKFDEIASDSGSTEEEYEKIYNYLIDSHGGG